MTKREDNPYLYIMKKIILLLLLSVNLSVLSNDSLFKKNHTTALDYHEKNELAIAERLNKKIGVGINSDSDCRNKYSIDDLINLLICESFQGKKKIGVELMIFLTFLTKLLNGRQKEILLDLEQIKMESSMYPLSMKQSTIK